MTCLVCKRDLRIAAKGLCGACYSRMQRRGTVEYAPVRVRGICSVYGCSSPHIAKGYCLKHYERMKATGDPMQTKRPDDWGAKHKHPMFNRWSHLMRQKGAVCETWKDFITFVMDVGEVPSTKSKLFSADDSKPIGPGNFVWKDAITQRAEGEDADTYRKRKAVAYRKLKSEEFQGYDLKRHYGLSRDDYERLHEEHGHKCCICKQSEGVEIRGKAIRLAVDHCHSTGQIRGILCAACNRALGGFRDSVDLLNNAIEYLKKTRDDRQ